MSLACASCPVRDRAACAVLAPEERAALAELRTAGTVGDGVVETRFVRSARAVLERAYDEARGSFQALAELGHWFDPSLADDVVHAIVGLDGVARMEALTAE